MLALSRDRHSRCCLQVAIPEIARVLVFERHSTIDPVSAAVTQRVFRELAEPGCEVSAENPPTSAVPGE